VHIRSNLKIDVNAINKDGEKLSKKCSDVLDVVTHVVDIIYFMFKFP